MPICSVLQYGFVLIVMLSSQLSRLFIGANTVDIETFLSISDRFLLANVDVVVKFIDILHVNDKDHFLESMPAEFGHIVCRSGLVGKRLGNSRPSQEPEIFAPGRSRIDSNGSQE